MYTYLIYRHDEYVMTTHIVPFTAYKDEYMTGQQRLALSLYRLIELERNGDNNNARIYAIH